VKQKEAAPYWSLLEVERKQSVLACSQLLEEGISELSPSSFEILLPQPNMHVDDDTIAQLVINTHTQPQLG